MDRSGANLGDGFPSDPLCMTRLAGPSWTRQMGRGHGAFETRSGQAVGRDAEPVCSGSNAHLVRVRGIVVLFHDTRSSAMHGIKADDTPVETVSDTHRSKWVASGVRGTRVTLVDPTPFGRFGPQAGGPASRSMQASTKHDASTSCPSPAANNASRRENGSGTSMMYVGGSSRRWISLAALKRSRRTPSSRNTAPSISLKSDAGSARQTARKRMCDSRRSAT
jgi:hypothetical protein